MPYLGDYIGYLLSEITNARVQADHETMRLAELYASDPLLKHMPVPRFRLPTVTLEVPIAIKDIQKEREVEHSKDEILSYMRKSFDSILESQLKRAKIIIPIRDLGKIKESLDITISDLKQSLKEPLRTTHIIDNLISDSVKTLRELSQKVKTIDENLIQKLASELRTTLQAEFTKYLKEPGRLDVLVTTSELREIGPTDILTHLRFTISEQAVEWTSLDTDGGEPKKHLLISE